MCGERFHACAPVRCPSPCRRRALLPVANARSQSGPTAGAIGTSTCGTVPSRRPCRRRDLAASPRVLHVSSRQSLRSRSGVQKGASRLKTCLRKTAGSSARSACATLKKTAVDPLSSSFPSPHPTRHLCSPNPRFKWPDSPCSYWRSSPLSLSPSQLPSRWATLCRPPSGDA